MHWEKVGDYTINGEEGDFKATAERAGKTLENACQEAEKFIASVGVET